MTETETKLSSTSETDGMFIDVEVAPEVARDPEFVEKLIGVCPVDIFARGGDGTLEIVGSHLDECVLCDLCLKVVPQGTVKIRKLYE